MTAPVVGSGSWPAWMQRVEKSSWFDLVIRHVLQARLTVHLITIIRNSAHSRESGNPGAAVRDPGSPLSRGRTEERTTFFNAHPHDLNCNPKIVDQVETGRHAEKLIAVHDDGDVVLAEQRQEIGDRRVGGNRLESRRHHLFDRPRKGPVRVVAFREPRGQYVALVDEADHVPAGIDDRQLRDIGGTHAGKHGAQIVLGLHHDGSTLTVAADDDVAHGAVPIGMAPAFLRQKDGIEHLGQILRAGVANEAHDALGRRLRARSAAASSVPEEDPASTPSARRSSRALAKLSASGIANARDTSERSALGGTKSSPMPSTAQLPACTMRPVST